MAESRLPGSLDALIRQSETPVLVDFWAEWCGPCRMVAPIIQKIAAEYKGKLLTVKVNVDQKPQVAARYNVNSIPTLMLFHQGKVLMRRAGAVPYEALKSEIDQHLSISGKSTS